MSNSKLIPLGSQGLQSSRIGFGGMSIGIKRNWNGKDLYGKKVPSKKGIHELIATLKDTGINHTNDVQNQFHAMSTAMNAFADVLQMNMKSKGVGIVLNGSSSAIN